jgi:hypothetical protein
MSKKKDRPTLAPLAPRAPCPSGQNAPSLTAQLVPILPGPSHALQAMPAAAENRDSQPTMPCAQLAPPSTELSLESEACHESTSGKHHLRSGKWLPEEEEYAQLLIALFDGGLLIDCDNGATLRSYLSQKLRCAPMRISKKFAGKGIGKSIYTCKVRNTYQRQHLQSAELKARVARTEQNFLNAIDPAGGGAASVRTFVLLCSMLPCCSLVLTVVLPRIALFLAAATAADCSISISSCRYDVEAPATVATRCGTDAFFCCPSGKSHQTASRVVHEGLATQ